MANKEKLLTSLKRIDSEYPELHLQFAKEDTKRTSLCNSSCSPPPYIDMNGGSQTKTEFFPISNKELYDVCQPIEHCDSLESPSIAGSEEYISEDAKYIPDVPASDLYSCSKSGYLDKRKRESIKGWLNPFQKRWCAMKNGVFYYYEKKTDRKQRGHIVLIGYEARILSDDTKDGKKYNFCFELVCPGKRTYQFAAATEVDMKEWISVIENYSKISNSSRPTSQISSTVSPLPNIESIEDEEIYEIVDDDSFVHNINITKENKTDTDTVYDPKVITDDDFNYNEWYMGLWDCLGQDDSELNFQRGDMIKIISKEYDNYAWWIGQIQEKVGFVPKSYLMEAYEAY